MGEIELLQGEQTPRDEGSQAVLGEYNRRKADLTDDISAIKAESRAICFPHAPEYSFSQPIPDLHSKDSRSPVNACRYRIP
jgi:hypothetical protein